MAGRINAFRRSLVEAVEARQGDGRIDLHAMATVDTACHWQKHLLLAARWLRLEADKLTPDQRLSFSKAIASASMERDRCIRLLGIDRGEAQDVWAALDRQNALELATRVVEVQVEPQPATLPDASNEAVGVREDFRPDFRADVYPDSPLSPLSHPST